MTEPVPSASRQLDSREPISRRSAIAATAWSLPVLAVAVAAPASATSVAPAVPPELTLVTPQPQAPGAVVFSLTVPSAQLPLPAATTLVLQRTSETGFINSASFAGNWNYSWPNSGLLQFFPTENVMSESTFTVALTGPSTWTLTLTVPDGATITRVITVTGPV